MLRGLSSYRPSSPSVSLSHLQMLARASSDAGTRLRRSKFTSTVHRQAPPIIETFDPHVAQQHAIAAATAAFTRSQTQKSTEQKVTRSMEISRNKSTASRKSLGSQGSHFPPRESSIRSVPQQKSMQATSADRHALISATNTGNLTSFEPTTSVDRPLLSTRALSTQPSITFSEHGRPVSQLNSNRQSTTSSIAAQQIRKARSMYYASSVQTGSPIARPPAKYLTTPPPISVSPALGSATTAYVPTRSTRPSPLAAPRLPVTVAPDETINQARDKHFQEFQQRSIKHKPSMFLAPFKKRQDKAKEKVKRMPSNITPVSATDCRATKASVLDITVSDFMPPVESRDRRSFSGSLKRKIKRVFRRASNKSPSLPVQQIEASRDYFGSIDVGPPYLDDHYRIPAPDRELLERVRSHTPSSEGRSPRLLRSVSHSSSDDSARSNRSLHSEANVTHTSASRVTSWGTSASGETLTQRAIKRLTVIHEARDSISSVADQTAPASTKRKSLPIPALSAFKDPMHMESLAGEALTPTVDPKRVFSALMREIDASKPAKSSVDHLERTPGAGSDVFESSKTKRLCTTERERRSSASRDFGLSTTNEQKPSACRPASAATRSVQSKKSSIRSLGQAIKSTIRTVTPGEHRSSPGPGQVGGKQVHKNTPSSDASSRSHSDCENRTTMFRGLRITRKR